MDVKAALGKEIGPFPVGIWLVVIAGGLGIGLYGRRFVGSKTDTSSTEDPTTTAGGTMVGGNASSVGDSSSQDGATTKTNSLGQRILQTNEEWYAWAATVLVGRGYSASSAAYALSKYLRGESLSQQEQAVVDAALQFAGQPPQIVITAPHTSVVETAPNDPDTPSQVPNTPSVTLPTIAAPQSSAAISNPSQIAALLPTGTAVAVVNPIAGDNSSVVAGKNNDGNPFVYGGSPEQAALLTQQAPTPPSAPVISDGIGRRYQDANGFWFTAG